MSPAARIGVIVAVAAVAFGGAFLLFGGDSGEPGDVVAGNSRQTSTTPSTGSANASESRDDSDGEGRCAAPDAVGTVDAEGSPYQVTVQSNPDPPTPQGTKIEVAVQREGQPVSGANVCITANMTEMSHAGTSGRAEEIAPGQYELGLSFSMRGRWNGRVLVIDSDQAAVEMPVSFDVR